MKANGSEKKIDHDLKRAATDARISYPCYKSFDEFIDVRQLCKLDDYLTKKIKNHIQTQREEYFLNLYRLDENSPYQPGVREIWLSRTKKDAPPKYVDFVDKTDVWELTKTADDFTLLMDFIETLPFRAKGRMIIFYDDAGISVPAHRDHLDTEVCNEFVWFRTNLRKPFYLLNQLTNEKKYVESYSAWFDSVNQYHGSDAVQGLSFSVRIDGTFTEEFRAKIPQPEFNAASTPALWACISGEK